MFLDFHHTRDRIRPLLQQEGSIDSDEFQIELKKCVVLCRRCHREESFVKPTMRSLMKDRLLELAGGTKCSQCGYRGENTASLEFHHRDRSVKKFTIGTICRAVCKDGKFLLPMDDVVDEVKKCDVLCSNCHTARHYDMNKLAENMSKIKSRADSYPSWRRIKRSNDQELLNFVSSGKTVKEICEATGASPSTVSSALTRLGVPSRQKRAKQYTLKCIVCGSDFIVFGEGHRKNRKCCSGTNCHSRMAYSDSRPSLEELAVKFSELSVPKVAEFYGVDVSTAYRWKQGDRWFKKGL